ncbi:MAG: ROK family protein, partial [Deinococcales bacterium]
MIERGLVFEAREAESTGVGRRKVLLEVDYEHASVVGIKVSSAAVHAALTDLKGDVRASRVDSLASTVPDDVVAQLVATLRDLRAESGADVVGLGVSVPGSVDPASGTVTYSPLLGWEDVSLGQQLERAAGLPVVVENDVNALAAAEAWFGHGHEVDDFLVVTLGRGVGLGIVVNGSLYRGPHGGAGELGHVVLEPGGPAAAHSKAGAIEAYL